VYLAGEDLDKGRKMESQNALDPKGWQCCSFNTRFV